MRDNPSLLQLTLLALLGLGLAGCADDTDSSKPATTGNASVVYSGVRANRVLAYRPQPPPGVTVGSSQFWRSHAILGDSDGSAGVVSLGDDRIILGGSITVGLGRPGDNQCITNGPGADFVVHENVFADTSTAAGGNFIEAVLVEASEDGSPNSWHRFSPTYPAFGSASADFSAPTNYDNLAGVTVGGDSFDLSDLLSATGMGFRACFLRFIDAGSTIPDRDCTTNGVAASCGPTYNGSGADLDAVHVIRSTPF